MLGLPALIYCKDAMARTPPPRPPRGHKNTAPPPTARKTGADKSLTDKVSPAKTTSGKKAPGKATTTAAQRGDDSALWEHVARSVTPLEGNRRTGRDDGVSRASSSKPRTDTAAPQPAPAQSRKKPAPAPVATPQRSTRTLQHAPHPLGAAGAGQPHDGFDRATHTKLRKGQLEIEGSLDLHGMTQDEAYRALVRFVTQAQARGRRTLLIITGKGRVTQGGGVLRRLLPLWVAEQGLKNCVLACVPASVKDGGDGAFYLRLRKKKD